VPENPSSTATWKWAVNTVLILLFSLVAAWATNVNARLDRHEELLYNLGKQLPIIQVEIELLLQNHGIIPPKANDNGK
jgi:hypothetical protein